MSQAYAAAPGEICVHGNSGQLQDKGVDASHYGWGIDYNVAGTGSWLQYSIPIVAGIKIKAIRVFFTRDGMHYKDGWNRHLHVYDGPNVVKKFDNLYLGQGENNKTINKVVSMNPITFNNAMGISILPETKEVGGLKSIVDMEFHSLCGVPTP